LPFIHWFDWIEPNPTEDLSVIIGNMDVTWRMIANPTIQKDIRRDESGPFV